MPARGGRIALTAKHVPHRIYERTGRNTLACLPASDIPIYAHLSLQAGFFKQPLSVVTTSKRCYDDTKQAVCAAEAGWGNAWSYQRRNTIISVAAAGSHLPNSNFGHTIDSYFYGLLLDAPELNSSSSVRSNNSSCSREGTRV